MTIIDCIFLCLKRTRNQYHCQNNISGIKMHYVAQYMYFNSCSQIYPILKGYDNKSVVLAANLVYC